MPTKIEWATDSWNPITGCSPVSAGCDHCYARRMANRLRGRYGYPKDEPFRVTLHHDRLKQPLYWRKPRMIFVCSMGDLWHKDVPFKFIYWVWSRMEMCSQHIFIVLTKRPERMVRFVKNRTIPSHIWLGISVEDQKTADERIGELLKVPAAVRIVSIEPMLGAVDFTKITDDGGHDVYGVLQNDWVILGGETGSGARPMNPNWVRKVRNQCIDAGVPFFLKSNGIWIPDMLADPAVVDTYQFLDGMCMSRSTKKQAGRLLDGLEYNEIPEVR